MHLLDTKTLELHEFFDSGIPPYAILSHTWEQDEVSHQDLLNGRKKDGAGYAKIKKCCEIALRDGYEWAWVDTCCIDKKSSAELSEAINAMYGWYQHSSKCYAYLSDVERADDEDGTPAWPCFPASKWFTRGWTLQELLAPTNLVFMDCGWVPIGTRTDMLHGIELATGIPQAAFWLPRVYSVAQRMSWASRRETSRVEDLAYCLLGLFDIRMPLLYGEGKHAFRRLQEEIIRTSADETLFVWSAPTNDDFPMKNASRHTKSSIQHRSRYSNGLLAQSPSCFASCAEVTPHIFSWRKPYSMTQIGLKLSTSLYHEPASPIGASYLIPLNCSLFREDVKQLAIIVKPFTYEDLGNTPKSLVPRAWCIMPEEASEAVNKRTFYLQDRMI